MAMEPTSQQSQGTNLVASLYGVKEWLAPTGDTTGARDYKAVSNAQQKGYAVECTPGTFYFSKPPAITAELAGCGETTIWQPASTFNDAELFTLSSDASIRNGRLFGGGPNRATNPACDAIAVAAGATFWQVRDVRCDRMNGNIVTCAPATGSHGRLFGIRGEHNAGGVRIDNGIGAAVTAEINWGDWDIQQCEVSEILFLSALTDFLGPGGFNGSMLANAAANAITVQGSCQTIHLDGLDVGSSGTTPGIIMQILGAGGLSPSDVRVSGKLQGGSVGLVVNDATARSLFAVACTKNRGDGAQFNGTGQGNKLIGMFNSNNLAAGTGYDINVTSSVHLYIDAPQYGSPGGGLETANLNVAIAGNHVTNSNPPAGSTAAGFAPAGW